MLCQLSYAPGLGDCIGALPSLYAGRVQRRALGILFAVLAAVLAAVGVAALAGGGGSAGRLLVGVAALVIAAWLASLAVGAYRRG